MFNEGLRTWRKVALTGSGLLLACSAYAVQAQSSPRGGQQLEIAGVRPAMTKDEAIKALMANEPPFVDNGNAIEFRVPVLGPDRFAWSMKFEAKPPTDTRDHPVDSVELYFAPPPSEAKVLAFKRGVCFDCGDAKGMARAPLAANFLDSIAKRFGSTQPSLIDSRQMNGNVVIRETRYYIWTRTGQLLTEQELQRRMKYPARCRSVLTPDNARNSDSINFRAFENFRQDNLVDNCAMIARVEWAQDSKGVLQRFYISWSDYAGMLSAFSASADVVEGKANQQRKQDLDRASKNPTKL